MKQRRWVDGARPGALWLVVAGTQVPLQDVATDPSSSPP